MSLTINVTFTDEECDEIDNVDESCLFPLFELGAAFGIIYNKYKEARDEQKLREKSIRL